MEQIQYIKEQYFFLFCFQCFYCSFFDLLNCSWSDLLFISAMIKPFEFIKVLVTSVCTVPNARNTRRSTALGETPLIWYCARYPEPSNPAVDSVSVGCGCGMQRGSVHCCVPSFTFQYTLLHAQLQQLLLPLCGVFPNSFRGIGGLEGIQVLKRGKVFEVPKSFAAISNNKKKE